MPKFQLKAKFIIDLGCCEVEWVSDVFRRPVDDDAATATDSPIQRLKEQLERDGNSLEQLRIGGEAADDVFLTRWLNSKHGDVDQTARALQKHAQWRAAFVSRGRIRDNEISKELDACKVFLQGCNQQGHSLLIVLARRHDMNIRDFKQTEKLIVYTLDAASALADLGGGKKICCLFDLSGLMLKNLDVKVLTAIFELLQKHYPERLGMIWFVNAPFIFWAVWRMVCPLIEECSREKIRFVSCSKNRCSSFLQDSVADTVLPWCYGGNAEMIPIDSVTHQLFQGKITDPNQVPSIPIKHRTEVKETWRAWLKRHKKLSRVTNWITSTYRVTVYNRFNRYLWTKLKDSVWKQKERIYLALPPRMTKETTLRDFMTPDPQPYPLASLIMRLLAIDAGLILVAIARTSLFNAVESTE